MEIWDKNGAQGTSLYLCICILYINYIDIVYMMFIYIIHLLYIVYIYTNYIQYIYFIYTLYTVYILRGVARDACGLVRFKKIKNNGFPPRISIMLCFIAGCSSLVGCSPPSFFAFLPSGILAGLSLRCVCVGWRD